MSVRKRLTPAGVFCEEDLAEGMALPAQVVTKSHYLHNVMAAQRRRPYRDLQWPRWVSSGPISLPPSAGVYLWRLPSSFDQQTTERISWLAFRADQACRALFLNRENHGTCVSAGSRPDRATNSERVSFFLFLLF